MYSLLLLLNVGVFFPTGVQLMEYNLGVAVVLNASYRETRFLFKNERQLHAQNGFS